MTTFLLNIILGYIVLNIIYSFFIGLGHGVIKGLQKSRQPIVKTQEKPIKTPEVDSEIMKEWI